MVGFLRTNLFTVKSSALLFASRRLFSEFSSAALVFSSYAIDLSMCSIASLNRRLAKS